MTHLLLPDYKNEMKNYDAKTSLHKMADLKYEKPMSRT